MTLTSCIAAIALQAGTPVSNTSPESEPNLSKAPEERRLGPRSLRERTLRTVPEISPEASRKGSAGAEDWLGADCPRLFQARHVGLTGALALLPGFGTGMFYAGRFRGGLVFAAVDTAVIGALVATGVSLAGHPRGDRGERLRRATWGLGVLTLATRIVEIIYSVRAAQSTNRALSSFSYVPLGPRQ